MKSPEARAAYQKAYRAAGYQARTTRVSVSLDATEAAQLAARARQEGLRPTTFLAKLLTAELARSPLVAQAVAEELKTLSFLIRGIANNVNQMAHYSNTVRGLVHEQGLLEELRKLEALIRQHTLKQLRDGASDDH